MAGLRLSYLQSGPSPLKSQNWFGSATAARREIRECEHLLDYFCMRSR